MIEEVLVAVISFLAFAYFLIGDKRLPPGPLRLPIIGSAIQIYLANSKFAYLSLSKLADKYGDVFSFGFGNKLAVIVSSYESMQEMFRLNDTNQSRYNMPFVADRNFSKNLGILFSSGQKWMEVKTYTKKVLREFGYGKVKIIENSLIESANQLVDVIETDLLDSRDDALTVKTSTFSIHVLNIVWTMVGGYKFDPNDASLIQVMKCLDKAVEAHSNANIYNVLPFLKTWCPKLVNYTEHLKIHEEIHGFSKVKSIRRSGNRLLTYLQFLIDHAIEKRGERLDTERTSFIEVFMDKIEEDQGNPDSMFTLEELQIILEDLFLGSMETTGHLLGWAILFMVLNPDKQNKVRQVILDKGANKNIFSATELKRIPYAKATILEIVRAGNVGPIPLTRFASADIKFRDYIVPKGTVLFCNLHPMFNNKAVWEDPEIFRPERFLNENGDIDQSKSERITNTVFGVGGRKCFGELIGMDSLYTFFATLVMNFRFESIPGQEPSAENRHFGLTNCLDEYKVKVTKLSI